MRSLDASSNRGGYRGSTRLRFTTDVREELDQDTKDLHEMGYAQELLRRMSGFSNFAVSFTIISILSGCLTLYGYGLPHGGPPVMLWGWLLVGTIVLFAGMSMGEICSAYPTAGGLYYWAAKLAPGKSGPIWSWFTGWFNLLGQVAVTAGISFGCAFSIAAFLAIWTGTHSGCRRGYVIAILGSRPLHPRPAEHLRRAAGGAAQRCLGVVAPHRRRHHLHPALLGAVLGQAPDRQLPVRQRGLERVQGPLRILGAPYVFLIGLLIAQYTFTGYDASAHVSEETIQARISAPKGIVNSIWISMIAGFILLVAVSFAIPHAFPVTHQRRRSTQSYADIALNRRAVGDRSSSLAAGKAGRPAAHLRRHRGAVLLRHVVGHRQLAHDLRVLA